MAARLATATALTGSMAACDGGFARVTDTLMSPFSSEPKQVEKAVLQPPAVPGNPVYLEGSRSTNNAAYEQEYGAPVVGSGQDIAGVKPGYAPSVYDDTAVRETSILSPVGAPPKVNRVGNAQPALPSTPIDGTLAVETGALPSPAPVYGTGAYSAPVNTGAYSRPGTTSLPDIGSTIYQPQSSYASPQLEMFSDASYQPTGVIQADSGMPMMSVRVEPIATEIQGSFETAYVIESTRDVEPLLNVEQPYGSTASHRYSVPSIDAIPSVDIGYAAITETPLMIEDPMIAPEPVVETAPVEVAFLSANLMPMPRPRPTRAKVYHEASLKSPVPVKRPEIIESILRSPLPPRRPIDHIAVSGKAITDAPALTEAPQMIEVDPIFLDEQPLDTSGEEVAALEPTVELMKEGDFPAITEKLDPEEALEAAPEIEVEAEPEAEETEVAALPTANDASDDASELSGTSWRLATLGEKTIEADAELHFDGTSGFAGGQAFCNNYGGEFKEKLDGTFSMANIFTTETNCPHLSDEKAYIAALEKAANYKVAPGMKTLSLIGPDGDAIATFTAF